MFSFLDDCLSICLREFSLGFAMTSLLRRALVLDNLFLPSVGARDRMLNLPLGGGDLFDNKFSESMINEAKRLKTEEKFDLRRRLSKRPASASGQPSIKKQKSSTYTQRSTNRPQNSTNWSSSSSSLRRQPPRASRPFKSRGSRGSKGQ